MARHARSSTTSAGSIVEGGSTITQQLAKNQYFTQSRPLIERSPRCSWR
ncbi:MAG: transglycosylase domain-containing protein [Eggerthellaceae bacterium]